MEPSFGSIWDVSVWFLESDSDIDFDVASTLCPSIFGRDFLVGFRLKNGGPESDMYWYSVVAGVGKRVHGIQDAAWILSSESDVKIPTENARAQGRCDVKINVGIRRQKPHRNMPDAVETRYHFHDRK